MTLYWFLLVVSSLALGSLPAGEVATQRCLVACAMLLSAWILLSQIAGTTARRVTLAGFDELSVARMFERQLDLFRWLGLAISAVCLVGFRLAADVKTWPVFDSSMTLQSIVLLTPGILLTASIWISEHRFGIAMGYVKSRGWRTIGELASALLATGGWILIPVFLILTSTDLLRLSGLFEQQTASAIVSVLTIVCVPMLLPLIMSKAWKTRAIADAECDWMTKFLVNCGAKTLPICIWDTGMQSYNAVVVGFLPGLRSLFVTDRLLVEMPSQQLAMVILHEIAHVQRFHVWLRMLSLVPSWAGAAFVAAMFPSSPVVTAASNLTAIAMTLMTLRWVAHRTEYDADKWACMKSLQMPAEHQPPKDHEEAATRYGDALRWVTRLEHSPDKASWLHPSIDDRCERLIRWACNGKTKNLASAGFLNH